MNFTFLSLSDLHISQKNLEDIKIVLNALWEDISKIKDNIDIIFLTGDLICNGSVGFDGENQYYLLDEYFIQPLIKYTHVKKENIFIVPGNHEVNRDKITFINKDFSDKFMKREDINSFIDNLDKYINTLDRIENYNIFKELFYDSENNESIITNNALYTTHKLKFQNYGVGIACLNSSWLSVEEKVDYGKLLLGERQIDKALNDLKDCELKVALMHHPVEYLKQFDQQDISSKLLYDFDIVITGHTHKQDIKKIVGALGSTLRLRNGSLFNGRAYNGYSVIRFDTDTNNIEVSLREYFDQRRKFDKGLSIIENGIYSTTLIKDSMLEEKKKFDAIKNIENKLVQEIDDRLLTTVSLDTVAPKEIEKIFVPPFMAKKPEGTDDIEQQVSNKFDIEEILDSKENIMFVGKKEYGKTTLLNFICKKMLERYKNERTYIPIIIDFEEIPNGLNSIWKAISNFLSIYNAGDIDIRENLVQGNFLILIDDLNIKNSKNFAKLESFIKEYSNNRYMFSMNEELLQTVKVEALPKVGVEYITLYMYSFRRGQVRELIEKWFNDESKEYKEKVLNKITTSIKEISVPQNPFMISLMLFIVEKQASYNPINEASLVEKFLEIILEKLNLDEITYNSFDYNDKIDYLAFIASKTVEHNKCFFSLTELYQNTENYCTLKGFEVDYEELIKFFISKGILIKIDNKIYFRFKCFLQFFIAKYMSIENNIKFKENILSEKNYLNYTEEIIFFVGLNRQDYSTMHIIEERLLKSFEKIDKIINIEDYIKIKTSPIIAKLLNGEEISKKSLEKLRLSNEEKDELLENPVKDPKNNYILKKQDNWNFKESFIENLELYSKIVKNSGLIDIPERRKAVDICINKYCKLLGLLYKIFFEIICEGIDEYEDKQDGLNNNEEDKEERKQQIKEFKDIIAISMPVAMQFIILENLGSPKLKVPIEQLLSSQKTQFEKFMLVSLYSDMKLTQYWKKIDKLINEASSSFFQQLIFTKLLIYNAMFVINDNEAEEIAKLIEKLKIKMSNFKNYGTADVKQYKKSKTISSNLSEGHKKRLIEKLKNGTETKK